tara:strand:- start:8511 stop:10280 length:1770 start_codon:yes stop_codon:yes gene_type:complete
MSNNIVLTILLKDFQVMPMNTTSLLKKFKIIEDNAEIILNSEYPGGNIQELVVLIKGFAKKYTQKLNNLITNLPKVEKTIAKKFSEKLDNTIRRPLGIVNGGGPQIDSFTEKMALLLYIFYGSLIFEDYFFDLYTLQTNEQIGGMKRNNDKKVLSKESYDKTIYTHVDEEYEDHESEIIDLDSRRILVGVVLYKPGKLAQSESFIIKLTASRLYYEAYKTEIQVYKSLYNSTDSTPTNAMSNIVKYYNSNDGNKTDFTINDYDEYDSDTYESMAEIDVENIGKITLDITDYISEIEYERELFQKTKSQWYIPNNIVIYFAIEWDKSYMPLEKTFDIIDIHDREPFMAKIYSNLISTLITLKEDVSFYHGDLKADNLLCDINRNIKLFDFDLSGILAKNKNNFRAIRNYRICSHFNRQLQIKDGLKSLTGIYPKPEDSLFLFFYDLHRFSVNNVFYSRIKIENLNDLPLLNKSLIIQLRISVNKAITLMNEGKNWNLEPMQISREIFDGIDDIAVKTLEDVFSDILTKNIGESPENIDNDVEMEDVFQKKYNNSISIETMTASFFKNTSPLLSWSNNQDEKIKKPFFSPL